MVLPGATPRLRFREMVPDDLPDVATLDLGGSADPAGWIDWNRESYRMHAFGLWVVETHSGDFVGDCGLTVQQVDEDHLVEIGWHVRAPLRRQGYATEAGAAVLVTAHQSGLDHVVAIIRPTNVASRRVAAKLGLTVERSVHRNGAEALVYGIDIRS